MQTDRLARLLGISDLGRRLDDVDRRLLEAVDRPDGLGGPCRRVTAGGGKRLRPTFTIAAAALGGVYDDRVVDAAAAVELVQIGSLVHDDLIDGATTRRGVPTINDVEGPDAALLAGDLLLARAGELAAGVSSEVASILASTIVALCIGQLEEVAQHLESIRGKTARLFRCACEVGAVCAGMPPDQVAHLAQFGESFGMAFQVLDDVLDIVGDPQRLQKPVGTDLSTGVYTLPVLLAAADPSLAGDTRRALSRGDVAAATALVIASGSVDAALASAHGFADDASREAASLALPGADALAALPRSYLGWALEEFTDHAV